MLSQSANPVRAVGIVVTRAATRTSHQTVVVLSSLTPSRESRAKAVAIVYAPTVTSVSGG